MYDSSLNKRGRRPGRPTGSHLPVKASKAMCLCRLPLKELTTSDVGDTALAKESSRVDAKYTTVINTNHPVDCMSNINVSALKADAP